MSVARSEPGRFVALKAGKGTHASEPSDASISARWDAGYGGDGGASKRCRGRGPKSTGGRGDHPHQRPTRGFGGRALAAEGSGEKGQKQQRGGKISTTTGRARAGRRGRAAGGGRRRGTGAGRGRTPGAGGRGGEEGGGGGGGGAGPPGGGGGQSGAGGARAAGGGPRGAGGGVVRRLSDECGYGGGGIGFVGV